MTNKISVEESTDQIGIVHTETALSSQQIAVTKHNYLHNYLKSLKKSTKYSLIAVSVILVISAIVTSIALKVDGPVVIVPYNIPAWNASFDPSIIPLKENISLPSASGIAAQLQDIVSDPQLSPIAVMANDAQSGKNLWSYQADMLFKPASIIKILTSAAALLVLPLNHRIKTKVVSGKNPDTIILMGGGDPTLSTIPSAESLYPGAATVKELADQIRHHINLQTVHNILVDQSLFSGPDFPSYWSKADIMGGSIAPIVPTMVDGDRVNPYSEYSARMASPGIAAGKALAKELGISQSVSISLGTSGAKAQILGEVESAPLIDRLHQMLLMSDNVMAAEIGMEIAQYQGQSLTLDHSIKVIKHILHVNGFDLRNSTIVDANGLSEQDRINPHAEMQVLVESSIAHPRHPQLRNIWDSMAIAGVSGTVAERFTGVNSVGNGYIHAKTGTLDGVDALVGLVTDQSGRSLDFVIISNSTQRNMGAIRGMIDSMVARLYECGCH